jgi:DNA-binding NarL/FixJ family response regulator
VPPVARRGASKRVAIGQFATLLRLGLETALGYSDTVSIVGSNMSVPELVTAAGRRVADVVVIDEVNAISRTTGLLHAANPQIAILAVLHRPDPTPVRFFARGVTACVTVDTLADGLVEASALAAAGTQVFVPGGHRGTTPASVASARLTPRQKEVLSLLAAGESYVAIAHALNISRHTVNSHVQTIFRTLDVSSRRELARRLAQIPPHT